MQGKGEGAISPSADPNRCGGGVRDAASQPSLGPFISAKRRPARRAQRSEVGRKEAPPDFVLRLKENTLEQRLAGLGDCGGERGVPGEDCDTSVASRSLASVGQRQPEGTSPGPDLRRGPDPSGATAWTSKGIKAGRDKSPGHNFSPLRPSCQLFSWLLASLAAKCWVGGRGRGKRSVWCILLGVGHIQEKQCGRQKQETG